ncbi:MAG: hypothetical protein A2086_12795 [Spirochaetes bacterium GWD1_27_9]|nr:MAG: hypothetical protein A2Z98_17940 [Spirochaetes bacterium GWB1_27_13]OHD24023.1 MAG: hypothetical protein A2Y34_13970 [Spirochaetes bacterium GWC1_27_15]OHD43955.1 MAG: hypothetical protein A2086_12795 [Spirochaetes bacterium GWD1_27_9]
MIDIKKIDALEKLIGKLNSFYSEMGALAKKSPNDGLNIFKLNLINSTIKDCNLLLGKEYKPFEDFEIFNKDDLPTNSDVTLILSQYLEALEKFRSDNITIESFSGKWYYKTEKGLSNIQTSPPAKIKNN